MGGCVNVCVWVGERELPHMTVCVCVCVYASLNVLCLLPQLGWF